MAKHGKGLRMPRSQGAMCTISKDVAAEMEEIASRILHIKLSWKKPVTTTSARKYLREFLCPYIKVFRTITVHTCPRLETGLQNALKNVSRSSQAPLTKSPA